MAIASCIFLHFTVGDRKIESRKNYLESDRRCGKNLPNVLDRETSLLVRLW